MILGAVSERGTTGNKFIEVFSDYIRPWCYFSRVGIGKLKNRYELEVRWSAFPLHPETPEARTHPGRAFCREGY